MSDTISAIGAKAQAPPVPPPQSAQAQAQGQAQAQAARPQVAAAPERMRPPTASAPGDLAAARAESAAPEKVAAGTEQKGAAPTDREENRQQAAEEKQPLTKDQAQEAVQSFMEYVEKLPGEMKFAVDQDTHRQVFKIVNPVTKEVVKQFPPDEFLTMIKRLKELDTPPKDNGIFLDEKS